MIERIKFGIGQPLRRVEDARLVTGSGRYTSDVDAGNCLHAAFLRSPHASALFAFGDLGRARAARGVMAVYTIDDMRALGSIRCLWPVNNDDGSLTPLKPYPIMADGKVFHVGDMVAMVVALSPALARDALDLIEIDWEPLAAVTEMRASLEKDAPQIFAGAPGNLAYDAHFGDPDATNAVFETAPVVARIEVANNRVIANFIEPRAAIAFYDADADSYLLHVASQGVHPLRDLIATDILKIDPARLRVVTEDVGGGFGTKTLLYREYPLILEAARRLGQPVRWVATRSEHFLGDAHGRDNLSVGEMAMNEDGRFLAMRLDILGNLGGYPSQTGPYVAYVGASMATGPYDIPTIHARVRGVYTNTSPTDAYRGAGNPEATYLLERLVDRCAHAVGVSPADIRFSNFIPSDRMPYVTPTDRTYDVGDFPGTLREALAVADHATLARRIVESRERGCLRGFGISSYVECTAWGAGETGSIELDADGSFTILVGTQSTGQGHQTAYAQVAAGHLGVGLDNIRVVQGDTARVASGWGTGGSRSIPVGAVMVDRATVAMIGVIKAMVASAYGVSDGNVMVGEGIVSIAGTNISLRYDEVARLADVQSVQLIGRGEFTPPDATYPNGTHCCEVEIDDRTGEVRVLRYVVVDDFGVTLNPLLLDGQIHGGIVQGLGQALSEAVVYGAGGELLTRGFSEYGIPRADMFPAFEISTRNIPSTTNPMGLKGAGEAGTCGATPAVVNAISDAIWQAYGPHDIDMPATPFAVFKAMREARIRHAAS